MFNLFLKYFSFVFPNFSHYLTQSKNSIFFKNYDFIVILFRGKINEIHSLNSNQKN